MGTHPGCPKRRARRLARHVGGHGPGVGILLVLESSADMRQATWELRIGYEQPTGWLMGGMHGYRTTGRPLEHLSVMTDQEVGDRMSDFNLLDVRQPGEWCSFHAPDAQFITGAELADRLHEVPHDRQVLVTCGSGYRSSIADSRRCPRGQRNVANLLGEMAAWKERRLASSLSDQR